MKNLLPLCHLIQTILLNLLRKYGIYEKHYFKLSMLIFVFFPLNMIHFLHCNYVIVVIIFLYSCYNINS